MLYMAGAVLALLIAYVIMSWLANAPRRQVAYVLMILILSAVLLVGIVMFVTGRLTTALPLLLSALAGIWRQRWVVRWIARNLLGGGPGSGAAGPATVSTPWLDMILDRRSGALSGRVKQGAFAGRDLGDLSLDDLIALYEDLTRAHGESARLLETFLDREHGAAWRQRTAAGPGAGPGAGAAGAGAGGGGAMTRAEALSILGLPEDADADEVRHAHRRLIRKLHPDQGGSSYLAAKINQAKDYLLAGRH